MKLNSLISFLCIAASALCTSSDPNKYEKYKSVSPVAPIGLTDVTYHDLTSKPRDFHVAVLLTATDARYGCALCREFQSEWDLIARSWNKGSKSDDLKLLLATLDFSNGKETFQKLMLQTAPVLLLFPPTVGPFAKVDNAPVSGHMFNHIRKVPYVVGDGKGGISYFAGGFSNQFGMETQIVAAISIALSMKVPRMGDKKAQQLAVVIWAGVLLCMYSFLLNVFKTKNGGYPFYLPPF
ncbi:oligosaccharyl transferase subunit ost3/OST6 [Aspergillus fumigatus]